jgi:methylphosphotriester-DNA--protein-cysteine methyltransferase
MPTYKLTDTNNRVFRSAKRGKLGGHRKLKIYGRLDCPSALRFIARGQYVQHRVFFADEVTAIAAGYRPCAKCMPEAYKKWKANDHS